MSGQPSQLSVSISRLYDRFLGGIKWMSVGWTGREGFDPCRMLETLGCSNGVEGCLPVAALLIHFYLLTDRCSGWHCGQLRLLKGCLMAKKQDLAYRLRWWLLVIGLLLIGFYLWFLFGYWPLHEDSPIRSYGTSILGTPLLWSDEVNFFVQAASILGVLLVFQWFFLRPARGWKINLKTDAWPMKTAIIAASFMAMLLTAGLIASIMELFGWWTEITDPRGGLEHWWHIWIPMLIVWAVWGVLFYLYWRKGSRFVQLQRMTRALIGGSILELLVAAPVHAFAEDPDNCYCARGSYTGLVFGFTVLIWCFGPGLVLLFLRERDRRAPLLKREDTE